MEPINVNLSCDIQQPVKVRYLDGYFFSKDSAGHRINVDVFDNGVPVSVGGSVSADVIRSDGETVPVTGAVSGNRAYVILPQAAYAVVGAVQITIKVTEGTTIVTIACFVAYVHESDTEITVDPGTIIPSIQALISQIETAVASIPADYSSLWTSLAPAFSSSTAYAVGQYVTNSGVLYRFTTAHPAGTWNSAHVTAVNLGSDISALKSAFLFVNDESSDVTGCRIAVWEDGKRIPIPSEGSTATLERNTASDSFCCVMDVAPGEIVHWAGSGGTNTTGVAYGFIDSENKVLSRSTASITNEERMTIAPDNAAKVIFNNRHAATKKYAYIGEQIPKKFDDFSKVTTGIEAITNAEPAIFDTGFYYTTPASGSPVKKTRSSNFACAKLKVSPGDAVTINATGTTSSNRLYAFVDIDGNSIGQCATNLSGVRTIYAPEGAVYCVINNRTTSQADGYYAYKGIPIAGIKRAVSFNFRTGRINNDGTSSSDTTRIRTPGYLKLGNRLHVHIPEGYKIKLFRFAGATYSSIVDYTDFITVDCDIKTYPESYYRIMIGATDDGDISTSAADGFSFDDYNGDIAIGSTGDTTDRKAEIEAYLNTYKKLRFEIGTYYVSGIEMPDYSIIEGSGAGSIIQLSGESDGNAITLGTMCTVKNIQIKGRDGDWSVSQGDPPPSTPENRNGIYIEGDKKQGFIENCYIHGFSGGAIVAYNTGTATNSGLLISSCYLLANSVGIYFVQKTEFHVVQNCSISGNYFGIIDNGANNTIVGCNISMSYYGFYHDMSDIANAQPNNMHGLLSNCEFKHINTRTIYINTTKSKFLLTGCQFGSSSEQPGGIELISAAMMQFTDCVASDNFPISVTNGGLTIFNGFFCQKPLGQITIVNNDKVKFINCFDTSGDPVVG